MSQPVLLRRAFSGHVYAITRYRVTRGAIVASRKHDVTEEFWALVYTLSLRARAPRRKRGAAG